MIMLEAKGIEKVYKTNSQEYPVLNNVNLTVHEGDFVGIMGPSGSGKSTLLNVLSSLDFPSNGEITIKGQNLTNMNSDQLSNYRRENIGFIFQNYNLLDHLTIEENILLPAALRMGSKKGVRDKLETLVNELNIEPLLPKYPYEISGGQQQRAAIIRSLINDPYLLFADEPTGNLDSKSAYDVLNILKTLNETHKSTILMVTHDSVAASFCNRVIFLKDGKIVHEMQRSHEEKQFSFNQRILLYISKEVGENDVNIFTRT
ncbi:ABC transporter ATP-binding protein [Bacillus mycoides]|uniref:ABC transporter ATP-binding protein n=1 Tax=Bacillus mycoides TaxID=1405 RepID=UPI002570619D|nr:ABC transporter ATP-binding protein [Bacillus mycoides]WJE74685.1 ABC transporter ATP-binding protein [Bacillus mycoides]